MSIVVFQAQPALAHALLLYIKALPSGKASTQLKEPFHPFPRPEEFKIAISSLAFVDAVSPRVRVPGSGAAAASADHRARVRHPARRRAGRYAHRHTPRTADIAAALPGRPKVNTVVVDMLLTKVAPTRSRSTDPDWTPASDRGALAYVQSRPAPRPPELRRLRSQPLRPAERGACTWRWLADRCRGRPVDVDTFLGRVDVQRGQQIADRAQHPIDREPLGIVGGREFGA